MWLVMNKHGKRYYSDHARSVARIALKWQRLNLQPIIMVRFEGKYIQINVVLTSINETMRMMFQKWNQIRKGE